MPNTSHVLDEAREMVQKRIAELDEERRRLERALAELGGKATGRGRAGRRGRKRAQTSAAGAKKATTRRRRRTGTRADQAVALVKKNPGITASEIAKKMKIKPNYLYRVLGELEKEGVVRKKGRKYEPTGK